jgi:hypothetical protein
MSHFTIKSDVHSGSVRQSVELHDCEIKAQGYVADHGNFVTVDANEWEFHHADNGDVKHSTNSQLHIYLTVEEATELRASLDKAIRKATT